MEEARMDRVPSRRGRSNNPKQVLLLHDSAALPRGGERERDKEGLVCVGRASDFDAATALRVFRLEKIERDWPL